MNHADMVHKYLKNRKSATSLQILNALGIWRVSDAIHRLRKLVRVDAKMVSVKNRRGEVCRVAEYSLQK